MKKYLKVFLTILSLLLILTLVTGCGIDKKTEKKDKKKEKEEVVEEEIVEEKEEKKEEKVVEEKDEFSRGTLEGDVYTNTFTKFKFSLPKGWEALTDEEIAKLMGVSLDLISGAENQKEKLDEYMSTSVVYGISAKNSSTGDNVILQFQKMPLNFGEDIILEETKKQLEAITEIDYTIEESSKEMFCGEEYSTLEAKAEITGIKLIQKYYSKVKDGYLINLIITATSEENLNEIISSFDKI